MIFLESSTRSYTTESLDLRFMDNRRGTLKFDIWISGGICVLEHSKLYIATSGCGIPVNSQSSSVVLEFNNGTVCTD